MADTTPTVVAQKAHAQRIVDKLEATLVEIKNENGQWPFGLPPALGTAASNVQFQINTIREAFSLPEPTPAS